MPPLKKLVVKHSKMTTEQLQHLAANASRWAGQLKLPLQTKVWKGQSGDFTGAGVGSSLDFQDHRTYAPGDDPRHINWQAYARTGQYTMKLYQEEVRPVVDLVFDVSESMFFDAQKAERNAELFYLLYETAMRAGASLQTFLVSGEKFLHLAPEAILSHSWLEKAKDLKPKKPGFPILDRIPFRSNAIRIFLSDLLYPGAPEPLIRTFTARRGSLLLFCPFLESEAEPEWDGNYDFIDIERGARHPHRIDAGVLKRYLSSYRNHFSLWQSAALRHQAKLVRIPCHPDLYQALALDALPAGALEISS